MRSSKLNSHKPRGEALRTPGIALDVTDDELVKLQLHRNDFYVRHARRLLQERAAKPDWQAEHRRYAREMTLRFLKHDPS